MPEAEIKQCPLTPSPTKVGIGGGAGWMPIHQKWLAFFCWKFMSSELFLFLYLSLCGPVTVLCCGEPNWILPSNSMSMGSCTCSDWKYFFNIYYLSILWSNIFIIRFHVSSRVGTEARSVFSNHRFLLIIMTESITREYLDFKKYLKLWLLKCDMFLL